MWDYLCLELYRRKELWNLLKLSHYLLALFTTLLFAISVSVSVHSLLGLFVPETMPSDFRKIGKSLSTLSEVGDLKF